MAENRVVKYAALSLLILMVAFQGDVKTQTGPLDNSMKRLPELDKAMIVAPPKNIDFKIIVIVPDQKFQPSKTLPPCSVVQNLTPCVPDKHPRKTKRPFHGQPSS
jgi:hypothetical protein